MRPHRCYKSIIILYINNIYNIYNIYNIKRRQLKAGGQYLELRKHVFRLRLV